jgi:hypothetical protein
MRFIDKYLNFCDFMTKIIFEANWNTATIVPCELK